MTAETLRVNEVTRSRAAAGVVTVVLRVLVSVIVIGTPVVFTFAGLDPWRIPKTAFFRAGVIITAALIVSAALVVPRAVARPSLRKPELALLGGTLLLSMLTTLITTDRVHSIDALITVACSIAFFVLATMALRGQPLVVTIGVIALPAIANSVFVLLQALNLWNPVAIAARWMAPSDVRTGFLGNSNFVGTFLVTPALFLLLAAIKTPGRMRILSALSFVVVLAGFLLSRTLTATIALGVAVIVLAVTRGRRNIAVTALVVAVVAATFVAYPPLRHRLQYMRRVAQQQKYDHIFSGRLLAYVTTIEMIRDRPLLGVGLGCYELQYMHYNRPALMKYPRLKRSVSRGVNFGEAHNEPLQYWAETGILGAVLFFAALVLLALRGRDASGLLRVFAPSFAVMLFVLCLAQFPFHLAGSLVMNLYAGAFCFAHDPRD